MPIALRPTDRELTQMVGIVDRGLRDGAVGLSTGLTYTPGMYATDEELVALLAAVWDWGGYHGTHHRNYGSHAVEAYRDAIDLARRASVALHLTHCHVNFLQNRGRAGEVLRSVDDAIAEDVDVTLDSYPYLAGGDLPARVAALVGAGWQCRGGRGPNRGAGCPGAGAPRARGRGIGRPSRYPS